MVILPALLSAAAVPVAVSALQLPFSLTTTNPPQPPPPSLAHAQAGAPVFTLQHAIHLNHHDRSLPPLHQSYSADSLTALSLASGHSASQSLRLTPRLGQRPSSQEAFQAQRRSNFYQKQARAQGRLWTAGEMSEMALGSTLGWDSIEVLVPDVSDYETVANLAKMTSNAYRTPDKPENWYPLTQGWNVSDSFGWLEDGIRGHIYANQDNSTIVVSIKGTSAAVVGGGDGKTGINDKTNDNLLFSCCCARVSWAWTTVCDCYDSSYTCRQDCLEEAVMTKTAYYPVATDLYNNITALYPHAHIILTGHSLGGALASLLALTYGVPAVSYEAVPDLLPAKRLHLPLPPDRDPKAPMSNLTTAILVNSDPIAMGVCNGALSTCGAAGFALETKCHSGRAIIYDTVGRLGWSVDIRAHRIDQLIGSVFVKDWGVKKKVAKWGWWPGGGKKPDDDDDDDDDDGQHGGRGVPDPTWEEGCIDCGLWEFVDG